MRLGGPTLTGSLQKPNLFARWWQAVVVLLLLASPSHAKYDLSSQLISDLPFISGAATVMKDGVMYFYGGQGIFSGVESLYSNTFFSLSFDINTGDLNYQPLNNTAAPPVAYSKGALSPDGSVAYFFGGISNMTDILNTTRIMFSIYNFDTSSWTFIQYPSNTTGSVPAYRYYHTVTLAPNGIIYMIGGVYTSSGGTINETWAFDPRSNQFAYYGGIEGRPYAPYISQHVSVALPDGRIVSVMGVDMIAETMSRPMADIAHIFDTTSLLWSNETLHGDIPAMRLSPAGVLGADQKTIYIFGGGEGFNGGVPAFFHNDVLTLDTSTWTWSKLNTIGERPQLQSLGNGFLLTPDTLVFAFGSAISLFYQDINVLRLVNPADGPSMWLENLYELPITTSESIAKGIIAVAVICSLIGAAIIVFLLWRFRRHLRRAIMAVHRDFWRPRTGEPLWTETCRLVLKVILFFLFVAFFVFVVEQVVRSPNATLEIYQGTDWVDQPDVRVCFTGYADPEVECMTDMGYICSDRLVPLDMSLHKPRLINDQGNTQCYLYMPADTDKFGSTMALENNNGSMMTLSFYGTPLPGMTGGASVWLYPTRRDPNRLFYFNDTSQLITEDQLSEWLGKLEVNDMYTTAQVYDFGPLSFGTVTYQLSDHQYLKPVGWNNVGFAPKRNSTPEITLDFREMPMSPGQLQPGRSLTNKIYIKPAAFATLIQREQKIYSLINAVGFIGGLFGLFVALQTWLFGFRPQSPWGIVQRWSVGDMRRSISDQLKSRFDLLHTPVPLVNPVHRRFSMMDIKAYGPKDDYDSDSDDQDSEAMPMSPGYPESEEARLARVEERMQLLELLFKSYYINDEVFRRLDRALRKPDSRPPMRRNLADTILGRGRRNRSAYNNTSSTNSMMEESGRPGLSIFPFRRAQRRDSDSAVVTPPPLPQHVTDIPRDERQG